MSDFSFISFIIGVIIGTIITLVLLWIAYFTRIFLFTHCPKRSRPCGSSDYYNDPGNALAHNPNLSPSDILFINNNHEMFYKRVPRNTNCNPDFNQLVYIKYPQYCAFTGVDNVIGLWKQTAFNSNIYKPVDSNQPIVTTKGNCTPDENPFVTIGTPVLKWDPNPISN